MSSPQYDSTSDCGDAKIAPNRPSFVSNKTTTDQIDTAINNDDNSQYFATPIENNQSATEIRDTKTTTTQVLLKFQLCLY